MHFPEENNLPLFSLTIKQFSNLLKRIIGKEVELLLSQLQEEKNNQSEEGDICDVNHACKITKMAKPTLYSKVSLNQIPYLSRGKPLLFSRKQLKLWIGAGRPKTNNLNRICSLNKKETINNCETSL